MSDENPNVNTESPTESPADGTSAPGTETPSESSEAWRSVVAGLDALGEAIARWAKAAVNDPDNKRRVDEFSARLDGLVSDVSSTVRGAADSEIGAAFKHAGEATGDAFRQAGEKVSEEVGPRLASAFKSMGDKLRNAAERIEEKGAPEDAASTPAAASAPEVIDVPPVPATKTPE